VDLSDKNISKAGKIVLIGSFIAGGLAYAGNKLGVIGISFSGMEPLIPLVLGGFVLAESAIEDKGKLMKGNPLVVGEVLVGAALVVYGVGLTIGNTALSGPIAPYSAPLMLVGVGSAALEVTTNI